MRAEKRKAEDVLPFDFRGHLHTFITSFSSYAAVCTSCTSFGSWSLFGLFPFKGTAYSAYGRIRKSLESGFSLTARRYRSLFRTPKAKAHTDPHTDFADFRRNRPPMKSIRLRPSLIPFDA